MNSSVAFEALVGPSCFFQHSPSLLSWNPRSLSWVIWALATTLVVFYGSRIIHISRKGKLPPGPRGVPFFGNLFQLSKDAWLPFTEWKYKYGDLVYISVVGQEMLILNSHKVATDLLDRRARIYSDRPRLIVASEILTGGLLIPFATYGNVWRRMRRASHEGLKKSMARNYCSAQLKEAVILVDGILKDASNWDKELKRAASSMILGVVYDKPPIGSCHDPSITRIAEFNARVVKAAFPGAHYAEYFRWMKYLPASVAKWKRDALEWYDRDSELFEGMYGDVKDSIKHGDERPSFATTLIRDEKNLGLSKRESAWLAGTLYAAGVETTSTAMAWFMLAMVTYPDVQRKAQAELDAVVGRSRMPTFVDRDQLPFIAATVCETLRWRTMAPVGVPHQSTEDDWYEGHFIPKGTICLANVWSMNKDPDVYGSDAEDFNPSRHLDEHGDLAPALSDTKDGEHIVTSNLICVGRHVAKNSIFIDIASLLWATTIAPIKDSKGNAVMPDTWQIVNDGLLLRPAPFELSITPRFPEALGILSQTKELYAQ